MNASQRLDVAGAFVSSARFVSALTAASIGTAVFAFLLRQLMGWPALIAILSVEVALWALVLVLRRGEIDWAGLLPVSLMVFMGWATLSIVWSQYQWATLGALMYAFAFTVIAVAIALLRDTIQVVRAFGDVLRVALTLSLVIEVIAGLLIDMPIHHFAIKGLLAEGGPIQGVFGNSSQLGILALVALVTFGTEWRTRSVQRGVTVASFAVAGLCLVFSQSPVAIGATAVVGIAAAALYGLRRLPPHQLRAWQIALLTVLVLSLALAWVGRTVIINVLDAQRPLSARLDLWRQVWDLLPLHALEGWGWIGHWRLELQPFGSFRTIHEGGPESAHNALLDVWFQLGVVGVVAFLVLVVLAFTRSWLLAARQRSTVYTWPALVLAGLLVGSLAESMILVEVGWLTLVVCTVKASRRLSWRQAFATPPSTDLPPDPTSPIRIIE